MYEEILNFNFIEQKIEPVIVHRFTFQLPFKITTKNFSGTKLQNKMNTR